jgi:MoaA/NifB/PqqE/SkfB family radical SAM enzyme
LPDARKLYSEATTGCNPQCRTCIRNIWSDPNAPMSAATFQKILESLGDFSDLKWIVFTSFGEPLTHPRVLDLVAAIRNGISP